MWNVFSGESLVWSTFHIFSISFPTYPKNHKSLLGAGDPPLLVSLGVTTTQPPPAPPIPRLPPTTTTAPLLPAPPMTTATTAATAHLMTATARLTPMETALRITPMAATITATSVSCRGRLSGWNKVWRIHIQQLDRVARQEPLKTSPKKQGETQRLSFGSRPKPRLSDLFGDVLLANGLQWKWAFGLGCHDAGWGRTTRHYHTWSIFVYSLL